VAVVILRTRAAITERKITSLRLASEVGDD
jgi:hypothetical protein